MLTIDDIQEVGFKGGTVEFSWHLTNWCNYECCYCPVRDVLTKEFTKPDHAKLYGFVLARLERLESKFNVCLSGGEPTLNPDLPHIITKLSQIRNCQQISVMTNLSRSADLYRSLSQIDKRKVVIMAAYHPEYYSERWLTRAIELSNDIKRFKIMVNYIDNPALWDDLEYVVLALKEHGVKMKPNLLKSNSLWKSHYTQEFFERFKGHFDEAEQSVMVPIKLKSGKKLTKPDHDIEIENLNIFESFSCTPMSYNITIDGNIKNGCTGREMGIRKGVELESVRCPYDACQGRQLLRFHKVRL